MKKVIFFAFVFASLILIAPITTIAQENRVSRNISEQPDIDRLVSDIRNEIGKIMERFGYLPMVETMSSIILNLIQNIYEMLCVIFIMVGIFIDSLLNHIWLETGKRFNAIRTLGSTIFLTAWVLCIAPFQITLSKSNDLTNSINDCPCLQE